MAINIGNFMKKWEAVNPSIAGDNKIRRTLKRELGADHKQAYERNVSSGTRSRVNLLLAMISDECVDAGRPEVAELMSDIFAEFDAKQGKPSHVSDVSHATYGEFVALWNLRGNLMMLAAYMPDFGFDMFEKYALEVSDYVSRDVKALIPTFGEPIGKQ